VIRKASIPDDYTKSWTSNMTDTIARDGLGGRILELSRQVYLPPVVPSPMTVLKVS
jgi:hypothetical protein